MQRAVRVTQGASEGAEIELTDADGRVFTRVANPSGNFFDEPPAFSYPIAPSCASKAANESWSPLE